MIPLILSLLLPLSMACEDKQDIDGTLLPPTQDVVVRRRPMVPADDHTQVVIENLAIHDLTNMKAVHLTPTFPLTSTLTVSYQNMIVRNLELRRIKRTIPGLHIDFLLINGSDPGFTPPNVFISHVTVSDGGDGVEPLLLKDGSFGDIVIENYQISRTVTSAVIAAFGQDRIRSVTISDSPGLHINVECDPGRIGPIRVIRSPGATIINAKNGSGVLCDSKISIQG